MRHVLSVLGLTLAVAACSDAPPQPRQEPAATEVQAGRLLAQERCSGCHAVERGTTAGPNPEAPPFSAIAGFYPPEVLGEALSEGIAVGHEDMLEFRFNDQEVRELIEYLKTLK